jgi:uridine kinase
MAQPDTAHVLIIAIAGGSGSGKSTLAHALLQRLSGVQVLAEDDYYRCSSDVVDFDASAYDFDSPAAKDMDLLRAHLIALRDGMPIAKPLYDFTTHRRLSDIHVFGPAPAVILEGIHALTDPHIAALADFRILIDAPDDVRLARRLLRDVNERGRTPSDVVAQFFSTVRPNHHAVIATHRARADMILEIHPDTDIGGLADHVLAALKQRGLPAS